MNAPWTPWVESGVLTPFAVDFAEALGRMAGERDTRVLLAAALVSRAASRGHVCIDLFRVADELQRATSADCAAPVPWRSCDEWVEALQTSVLVGNGTRSSPLILEDGRHLYLSRYRDYENRLVEAIARRTSPAPRDEKNGAHPEWLLGSLDRLFGPASQDGVPNVGPRRAAELLLAHRLLVITGAPGTGKTSTVVKICALLLEQASRAGKPALRIALLAPTGKAAQRLGESVSRQVGSLACDAEIRERIPTTATTIHRCLGVRMDRTTEFQHHRERPLPVDVVVVDEASMIDLPLMTKLVEAVADDARLILIGDAHQLASVEVGSVFGELCAAAVAPVKAHADGASDVPSVVELVDNFRVAQGSQLGRLARLIAAHDAHGVRSFVCEGNHPDVAFIDATDAGRARAALRSEVIEAYGSVLNACDTAARFFELSRFRILCAQRHGSLGVDEFNRWTESILASSGLISRRDPWYVGRPILVTQNDYDLGVYNGDIGIAELKHEASENDAIRVAFLVDEKTTRHISPERLVGFLPAYAMTIHKSQGSEFDHVVVVLPPVGGALLSRELLYTAITRAKRKVTVVSTPRAIEEAVANPIARTSRIAEKLRRPVSPA